jgi:hypothetical protein
VAAAEARDESDLLALAPPALQRALLKVPDDLIAQATAGAPATATARVLENLSARRAAAIRALSARLRDSGELGPRAIKTALHNLVRQVFKITAPEAEDAGTGRAAGPVRRAASAAARLGHPENAPEPEGPSGPDLTPAAFARLREARAAFQAARRISPYVRGLERARRGADGAVLVRAWLKQTC